MATLLSMQDRDGVASPSFAPSQRPRSIAELDIRSTVVEDLILKVLYLSGSLSILELSDKVRLSFELTDDLFHRLRSQALCQVTGMSGNIPQIAITSNGRTRAAELLQQSLYAGPAPVAFTSYVDQIRKQRARRVDVHAADVERAFRHLVVDAETLRMFGTALNSGSALFLYGPAGVGKTTMAEVLSRVIAEDAIWIPHAIEVDGQIITVYDPALHKHADQSGRATHDERWELCHRPVGVVGGELTAEMLDMQFNPTSKYYVSPVQMKSNNGVLIIDDFGRQRIRPEELLNRWIVPLDRRIDFLTLAGGKKIEIPFEMLVVFVSNLDPAGILDPAFMRRIQTKIRIGEVSDEQFTEIFRRVAVEKKVPYDSTIPHDLISFIRNSLNQELRSCYPRDIVNQVCWAARYEEITPYIDRPTLQKAIRAYFPVTT